MRYWIWWNDLIQGPFEPDELTSMRAFSEDLLVCMEDREDWIPASRVADLSSAVEQLKARKSQPFVPPPPPPQNPPARAPLQGEFFGEAPGQQPLLESEDGPNGPLAYKSALADSELPCSFLAGQATTPFHFSQPPSTSVLELPRPQVEEKPFVTRNVVKESPVRQIKRAPEERIERKPAVSLKLLQEDPQDDVREAPESLPAVRQVLPPLGSSYENQPVFGRKLELLPWVMGVVLAMGLLAIAGYWLMDKASNHSAITEANRLEPPTAMSLPATTPLPAPKVDIQDRMIPPAVIHPARPRMAKRSFIRLIRKKVHATVKALKNALRREKTLQPAIAESAGTPVAQAGLAAAHISAPISAPALDSIPGAIPSGASSGSKGSVLAAHQAAGEGLKKKPVASGVSHHVSHVKSITPPPLPKTTSQVSARPPRSAAGPDAARGESSPGPVVKPAPVLSPDLLAVPPVVPGVAISPSATALLAVPPVEAVTPSKPRVADPWSGRPNDAINLVVAKTLPGSKVTVGGQAKTMLKQMHEKELMHAAETGERLYLPDKMDWAALQEEGAHYRVYLNFEAMQANGERVQTRSYQFMVDLKSKAIRADDPATEQDLLTQNAELNFHHNPLATDIDSILGGVDTYNKHKVQMMIIKKNRSNRGERTQIEAALKTAQIRIQRSIIYFRRTYPDKALQNIGKAYNFVDLVNGK